MMHREELLNAIIDAVRRQDSRALAARAAESHPSDMAEALATQKNTGRCAPAGRAGRRYPVPHFCLFFHLLSMENEIQIPT